jgi:hypothetical protein
MRMRVEDEKYRPKPPFWKNMSGDVALGNVMFAMEAVMAGLDTSGSQRVLDVITANRRRQIYTEDAA